MRVLCTNCTKFFEADDVNIGSTDFCPHCGAENYIKPHQKNRTSSTRTRVAAPPPPPECNTALCFALGLLFNVIGILIAAIIGKQRGCVCALYGFLTSGLIGVLLVVLANMIG